MPEFTAKVHCTFIETWRVEAADADEARKLFEDRDGRVELDDFGEIIDWKVIKIKKES